MEPACCWHKEHIASQDCPRIGEQDLELLHDRKQRFVRRCVECPRFLQDLENLGGGANGLASLFPLVTDELQSLRVENRRLASQVEGRNREIKFLHEVSLVLQTSVDRDEVIAMTLTAVTAGKGFGLNRAILLLIDKEEQNLNGFFAVGPGRNEDAGRIWREIEEQDFTLPEMAQSFFEQRMTAEREKFRDLLAKLSVPLNRSDHLFVRTLNDQVSRHIDDLSRQPGIDPSQAEALGVREMVLVPLVSKKRSIGLLLADNIVNGRPISSEDLCSLETFALPVSFAIERAALYEQLQKELANVREANLRLKEQQEQILRMEKMALVGKITANIAHSIRNPLTIIGGFARTLIKNTLPGDGKRQYIESIVREARHLEDVLEEVLNYAESLHPTFDLWDVNQIVTSVSAALREDLEANGVECRLDLEPGLPSVQVDYQKMSYCIRSIMNNALEALPGGGKIDVRSLRRGDRLHIIISDTGAGLSEEVAKSITFPFFSTKERGTGLGLSLCARILEEHGADMEIDSAEGRGTTFTIRLNIPTEENHGSTSGG